ncbi:hypothetical protein [Amycolatopsis sp. H20-H5]|uniref:hypothetical protein n=1 Tax=Amycolatopsis sp. H20-H5 TaxID=3046309 RepID=UPI002DBDAD0D|nr:hypothetical protein [Amycolatopsis sp. H20-H5]MEC3978362.1 hypothetical protein [Amycolatopsis sp. H20-H5]
MENLPVGAVDVGIEEIETMIVDCDRCVVRGLACGDCVVSVLLGAPPAVEWDADERRALDALAEGGMMPRLRMDPGEARPA